MAGLFISPGKILTKNPTTDVQFPLDVEQKGAWKPYWDFRRTSMCLALTVVVDFVFVLVILSMFPLVRYVPYHVDIIRSNDTTINIQPVSNRLPLKAMDLLALQEVSRYVVVRHEIVRLPNVMEQRWLNPGLLYLMSSKEEYARFLAENQPYLNAIRTQDVSVQVEINSVLPLRAWTFQGNGFYEVHFTLTSRNTRDQVILKTNYTAQVEVAYNVLHAVPYHLRYYNPTGFQAVAYRIQQQS